MERRQTSSNYTTSGNTLSGYAALFDKPTRITENGRSFTEVIRRGAFDKLPKDLLVTFNHDPNNLLGRTSSGTARVQQDDKGLRFEVDLPASAAQLRELVQRGDVTGASFAFTTNKDKWQGDTRELLDVSVFELGPVVLPAYKQTSLKLRSADQLHQKLRVRSYINHTTTGVR